MEGNLWILQGLVTVSGK